MNEPRVLHQWTDPTCSHYQAPSGPLGRLIHRALARLTCKECSARRDAGVRGEIAANHAGAIRLVGPPPTPLEMLPAILRAIHPVFVFRSHMDEHQVIVIQETLTTPRIICAHPGLRSHAEQLAAMYPERRIRIEPEGQTWDPQSGKYT